MFYNLLTDKNLSNNELPLGAIVCDDIYCNNSKHSDKLCKMYENIVNCLRSSCEAISQKRLEPNITRPGWNDRV